MKILIATRNPGKRREYRALLGGGLANRIPIEWVMLNDIGITTDVEETSSTFEENARLKAESYARESGLLTLADDSGLEVQALNGAPGVQSARYGGPRATDADRYRRLLRALEHVPTGQRGARFVCVVAVCTPGGELHTAEGECRGNITYQPRGSHGFGYDPIFYIPDLGMTMAEVEPDLKNQISHRARALEAIKPTLIDLIAQVNKS